MLFRCMFDHRHGGDDVPSCAAILLGDRETADAELGQAAEDRHREAPLAVPLSHRRARHLALDEATDRLTKELQALGLVRNVAHSRLPRRCPLVPCPKVVPSSALRLSSCLC